jgi:hypothetical protein
MSESDTSALVASILANDAGASAAFLTLFTRRPATDASRGAVLHVLREAPLPVIARLRVRTPHFWIDELPALLAASVRPELDDFVADLLGQLARWSFAACRTADAASDGALGAAVAARLDEALARRVGEPTHDADWLARTEPLAEGLVLAAEGPPLDRAFDALVSTREPRLAAHAWIARAKHGGTPTERDVEIVMRSPAAHWVLVSWLHTLGAVDRLPAGALVIERRMEAHAADWLALEEGLEPREIVCLEARTFVLREEVVHVGLCRYVMEPGQAPRLVFGEAGPQTHGLAGFAGEDDQTTTRAEAWRRLIVHHGLR